MQRSGQDHSKNGKQNVPPSRLLLPFVQVFPKQNAGGCNEDTERAFLHQLPYTLTMHFRLWMQKLDVGSLGETPILANPSSPLSSLALSPPPDSPSRPLDLLSVLWSITPTDS